MRSIRARVLAVLGVAVVTAVVLTLVLRDDGPAVPVAPTKIPAPPGTSLDAIDDPFGYDPDRREDFEARAARGNAHVLYAFSPGGAAASAERTARWRPRIEAAAEQAGMDPDVLEGMVFLESAGRPDARTSFGTEGAVGLTQIVSGTATQLLDMQVDVAASRKLTRRIERARTDRERTALEARRRAVDERYDPVKALAATARYITFARGELGNTELAVVSYHMGVGNLQGVLSAYADGESDEPLPYAQVYFDSSPTRHPEAWRRLSELGDDSSNYLWKVRAAQEIMRLHREDPDELARLQALQTNKNSAEEVLHPDTDTDAFGTPAELEAAYGSGDVVPLPDETLETGFRIDRDMGELAARVGAKPTLYRGLRPEALAMAIYIGAQVREASGMPRSVLTMTSSVRDRRYQQRLVEGNVQATRNFSLHTTGWAFDVSRDYASGRQAQAFQFTLDRLRSLDLIAWVREPGAIHITVSGDAKALLPLLRRG